MAEYRRMSMNIDNGPGVQAQAQPNSTSQYGQCNVILP